METTTKTQSTAVYFSDFSLSEIVYVTHDPAQLQRMITGILHRASGCVTYELAQGTTSSWHGALELSRERDILKAVSNEKD